MREMVIVGLVVGLLSLSAGAVLAQGNGGSGERICNRIEEAWQAQLKGYERAKEVRKKAFERTLARWEKLFTGLDGLGVNTESVRADAAEVKTKFEALLAADDKFMEAKKNLANARCAKEGATGARRAVGEAQKNRREARKAYNTAMKQLRTDLAKLRSVKKDTKTDTVLGETSTRWDFKAFWQKIWGRLRYGAKYDRMIKEEAAKREDVTENLPVETLIERELKNIESESKGDPGSDEDSSYWSM